MLDVHHRARYDVMPHRMCDHHRRIQREAVKKTFGKVVAGKPVGREPPDARDGVGGRLRSGARPRRPGG